jgi:hypothetical protein
MGNPGSRNLSTIRWWSSPQTDRSRPSTSGLGTLRTNAGKNADMKAARMHEYGNSLVLEDVPVPDIQPDEILVKVTACGMCRSDVRLVDGYFRKYADIPTPITLGHEITGVVHKLGSIVPSRRDFGRATTA